MNIALLNTINIKIKSTEDELKRIRSTYGEDSLEAYFVCEQLNEKLYELESKKNEINEFKDTERIKLVISGENVGLKKISARVLSSVLDAFQSITDSIANSLGNEPTLQGRIPATILQKTDLMISDVFPGSFGLELEGALEPTLIQEEPLLTQSLNKLFDLFSAGSDSEKLFEQISDLGPRTLNYYKQLIKTMSEYNINIECNWKSSYAEKYNWTIPSSSLPSLLESLETIKEENQEVETMKGKLTGINLRKETFELIDELGSVISGRSNKVFLNENKNLIDVDSIFTLVKTTIHNVSTGSEKINWFLRNIN